MTHDNASVTWSQHLFALTARLCRGLVVVAVLSLCYALCPEASAQTTSPNIQHTKNTPDLGLRGALKVDPSTLGMSIQIPLGTYPGRGGTGMQMGLNYNSKVWRVEFDDFVNGNMSNCSNPPEIEVGIECYSTTRALYAENSVAGWTFGGAFPTFEWSDERYDSNGLACCTGTNQGYYIPSMTVRFPDGSTHQLRRGDAPLLGADSFNGTYYSVDSSRMKYVGWPGAGTLHLPDGSRYESIDGAAKRYIDRNGNVLTSQTDTLGRQIITDTLGREITAPRFHNSYAHEETYSIPGVGGVQMMNYTFDLRELDDAGVREPDMVTGQVPALHRIGDQDKFGNNVYGPPLFTSGSGTRVIDPYFFNPVVLHRIVLPNGGVYTFTYNEYGEIAKVVYPTGSYERYRYGEVLPLSVVYTPYSQANRGVVERRVSATGSAADEVRWLYNSAGTTVTTFAPDGSTPGAGMKTVRSLHTGYSFGSVRFGLDDPRAGMAYDEKVYAPQSQGGAMLRRTLTEWEVSGPEPGGHSSAKRNPKVLRTVEILLDTGTGNPLAKTTTYQYGQASQPLNVTAVIEHGYVEVTSRATAEGDQIGDIPVGVPLRSTETGYLDDPAYNLRNLVGLPHITTVRAGGTENSATPGAVVARSKIYYDEGDYFGTDMSPLPCGATKGREASTLAARGNVTTSSRWLDTLGTVDSSSAYLDTHLQYDQCGNTRKAWDAAVRGPITPSSHISEREYSAAYEFAYLTKTKTPVPDPSGERGTSTPLESGTAYDFTTGKVTSTTDANSKTTAYQYNDALNRLTRVDSPDGGWTTYEYSCATCGNHVRVKSAINATQNTESYQYFDGMGRPVRAFLYDGTDSTPWSVADTYYDAMGRVSKVSNAYRVVAHGAATPAICATCTTSDYDALGRVIKITTPDGAQVTTDYSGKEVTVTDQRGKKRKSTTDALGRLGQVVEAPDIATCTTDGTGCATDYEYDVLGNLRHVAQGTQHRYFMYDSLGRLIRAKNPEQGTFTSPSNVAPLTDPVTNHTAWSAAYSYDANGNLSTRTDARLVSEGVHVTTTYEYDNINRLKQTTYNDGTPFTQRTYDKAVTNGRGRHYTDYVSSTSGTKNYVTAYDEMGRPTAGKTEFFLNGTESQPQLAYTYSREYDKMGHVTKQTYPSGHVVNHTQFDAAGRLKQFTGNLGDGTTRTYSTGIEYDAAGRMKLEQFGTQTVLNHKRGYNVRGQMCEVGLGTLGTTNRGFLLFYYSQVNGYSGCESGTDNNGNVVLSQHWVYDGLPGEHPWFNQYYIYDDLNRITSVREEQNAVTTTGEQHYTYDRWGNRQINAAATYNNNPALPFNEKQFTISTATNRVSVPSDQTGTMTYDEAGNLIHDSYTGQGARAYDAENRMTSAALGSNSTASYTYDAGGKRVRRQTPTGNVWQVYGFDGELLAEYAASAHPSTAQKEYGYRNGELLVTAEAATPSAPPPTSLTALPFNAAGNINITLNWNMTGAANYRVERSTTKGGPYALVGVSQMTPLQDTGVTQGVAYLYRVCAANSAGTCTSPFGNLALGMVYAFADDPIITLADNLANAPLTPIKAQHVGQLHTAVNAVRALAGLSAAAWAPDVTSGAAIRAAHVQELRERLNEALAELSLAPPTYTDETLSAGVTWIKRAHVQELRLAATRGQGAAQSEGSGGVANIQWLVSDHLGTPRMVADLTGSLAGIKRHDYLPFGEEIGAGVGGRTSGQGYVGNADGVKQHFTGQLRDDETGLDYFGARYYASVHGRFTGVDPIGVTRYHIANPQLWNAYSYALNNPLLMIDLDGKFPWAFYIRSFIYSSTVGGGFYAGDGRGPSLSTDPRQVSSRVRLNFTFDYDKRRITNADIKSDASVFYGAPGVVRPIVKEGTPGAQFDAVVDTYSGGQSVELHYWGKDPIPGIVTPNLDVHADIEIIESMKKDGTGTLYVGGTFTGDKFPSTEAFIADQAGNKVFLGAKYEEGGVGDLFGDNKQDLFKVDLRLRFDKKGNFTAVIQGGKTYTVEQWNAKVRREF
jgi:RHS repeat-associated protein